MLLSFEVKPRTPLEAQPARRHFFHKPYRAVPVNADDIVVGFGGRAAALEAAGDEPCERRFIDFPAVEQLTRIKLVFRVFGRLREDRGEPEFPLRHLALFSSALRHQRY